MSSFFFAVSSLLTQIIRHLEYCESKHEWLVLHVSSTGRFNPRHKFQTKELSSISRRKHN